MPTNLLPTKLLNMLMRGNGIANWNDSTTYTNASDEGKQFYQSFSQFMKNPSIENYEALQASIEKLEKVIAI